MAYNANALVRLAALKALAEKTKAEIDNINTDVSKAIKSLGVSGNTVSFYTSADKSGDAAFTFEGAVPRSGQDHLCAEVCVQR